jgi:hypothetical protein
LPGVEIRLDDQVLEHPESGPIRVSAGRREIVAEKPGYSTVRRVVEVLGGEEAKVALDMGPPIGSAKGHDSPNALPWIVGISSAALLIGAGATSYLAYRDSSDYSSELNHVTTQDRLDNLSSRAETKALVADILLGSALAGGVLTVILIVSGGSSERPASARLERVRVVPSGLQLQF